MTLKLMKHELRWMLFMCFVPTMCFAAVVAAGQWLFANGASLDQIRFAGQTMPVVISVIYVMFAAWRYAVVFAASAPNHKCFYYTLPISTTRLVLAQVAATLVSGVFVILLIFVFWGVQYLLYGEGIFQPLMYDAPRIVEHFSTSAPSSIMSSIVIVLSGVFVMPVTVGFDAAKPDKSFLEGFLSMGFAVIVSAGWALVSSIMASSVLQEFRIIVLFALAAVMVLIPTGLCAAAIYLIGKKRCV